jgi:hypothetical protein
MREKDYLENLIKKIREKFPKEKKLTLGEIILLAKRLEQV